MGDDASVLREVNLLESKVMVAKKCKNILLIDTFKILHQTRLKLE